MITTNDVTKSKITKSNTNNPRNKFCNSLMQLKTALRLSPILLAFLLSACSNGTVGSNTPQSDKSIDPIAVQIVEESNQVATQHAEQIFTVYLNQLLYASFKLNSWYHSETSKSKSIVDEKHSELVTYTNSFKVMRDNKIHEELASFSEQVNELIVALKTQQYDHGYNEYYKRSKIAELELERDLLIKSAIALCKEGVSANIADDFESAFANPPNHSNLLSAGSLNLHPVDIYLFSVNFFKYKLINQDDLVSYLAKLDHDGKRPYKSLRRPEEIKRMLDAITDSSKKSASVEYVFLNKADSSTVKREFIAQCSDLVRTLENIESRIASKTSLLDKNEAKAIADSDYENALNDIMVNSAVLKDEYETIRSEKNPQHSKEFKLLYNEITGLDSFKKTKMAFEKLNSSESDSADKYKRLTYNFMLIEDSVSDSEHIPRDQTKIDTDTYIDAQLALGRLSNALRVIRSSNDVVFGQNTSVELKNLLSRYSRIVESYAKALLLSDRNQLDALSLEILEWTEDLNALASGKKGKSKQVQLLVSYGEALKLELEKQLN